MNSKKLPVIALSAVLLIGLVGWWASSQMEEVTKSKTGQSLQVVLAGTASSIKNWVRERLADVKSTAGNRFFVELVENQLRLAGDARALRSGPYNRKIKEFLGPLINEKGYESFIVVDRKRSVISASLEKALGLPSFLAGRGDYIDQALLGRSLVSPILKVKAGNLAPLAGGETARILSMFWLSPVKDGQNRIIAVLILALNPSPNLDKLTSLTAFDHTGETYVFDQYGRMVTSSRFEDQLRRLGLLKPGQPSAGNTEVRDPGGDLTKGYKPIRPREDQDYTLMAESALTGESGHDLEGYRDYRGVDVVGAWTWDGALGLGMAAEVDRAEMFQILDKVRMLSLVVLVLTFITAATLVAIMWRAQVKATSLSNRLQKALELKRMEEKQRKEAEKRLIQSKESLAHAQAVAHVGSFEWDLVHDYVTWSDEHYRIFGKKKDSAHIDMQEILAMIHPRDVEKVDKGLKMLVERGGDFELEHRVLRSNGQVRWVLAKADVIRDITGAALKVVGTVQDITGAKAVQRELDEYRDNLEQQVLERTRKLTALNMKLEKEMEERELAQRRIRQSEARLNSLFRNAVEGIVTMDENSTIQAFNPAAEKMFGYSAQEAIGQNVKILMPEPIRSRHRDYVERYLRTGEEKTVGRTREVLGLHKNGGQIELEISVSVFKEGEKPMFTGILHDISERKRTEQTLKKAKQAAEHANQAKSRFLANMSHEIRTPMNTIIGYLALALEDSSLEPDMKKNLSTASRSANLLLQLINDILDVSKMEAGKLELERGRFNLHNLLEEVRDSFRGEVRKKGLGLELEIDPDLAQCYLGDNNRLRQVLINLIGNAVKFTTDGGITVAVRPDGQRNKVRFSVVDTGIGIPEDKIDGILEPFTQADVTTTRKYGGTGLGTSISRQIVEKMNGRLWLESEEGRGSAFFFTVEMPVAECSATCNHDCEHFLPSEKAAEASAPLRSFKVLLAEDLRENAELARIRLEKAGHRVTHVWDGAQAVARYGKEDFDLILMDVQMPELDGLQATRRIRELESGTGRHVPIIALTASVMQDEKTRCLASGMDHVAGKPVDFTTLFARMDKLVPRGRGRVMEPVLAEPVSAPKGGMPGLFSIDFAHGLELWQDEDAYRGSLHIFAETYAGYADEIRALLDRGELEPAYQKAHALKGVAGNLAVDGVYSLASNLCQALKGGDQGRAGREIPNLAAALGQAVQEIAGLPAQKDASG